MREKHPDLHIDYPLAFVRDPRSGSAAPGALGYHRDSGSASEYKVISRQSYERHWSAGPPIAYRVRRYQRHAARCRSRHPGAIVMGFQDVELVVHRVERHAGAGPSATSPPLGSLR
jgi:hypothetical protein